MSWAATGNSGHNVGAAVGNESVTTLGALSLNDRVVVEVGANSTSVSNVGCTVTDSLGNTYTSDVLTRHDTGQFGGTWSTVVTSAGTPTFVKATLASGTGDIAIDVTTYTGVSTTSGSGAIDKSTSNTGFNSAPSSGATAATTAANELVIGGYSDDGDTDTQTNGTGFTLRDQSGSSGTAEAAIEDKDSGSSGTTQTATMGTTPSGTWSMTCIVYKIAAGGAAAAVEPPMRTMRGAGI